MSFSAAFDSALDAIHSTFATATLEWWRNGEVVAPGVKAIPFHDRGNLPFGAGQSVGRKGFEVPVAALAFEPKVDDMLFEDVAAFTIINVTPWPEAKAWRVMVEETG